MYRRHIHTLSHAHKTMNRTSTTRNRFGSHEFIFIHAFKTRSFIIYFQVKQHYIVVQLQCGLLPTTAYLHLLNSKSLQHSSAWLLQMPQTIPKNCISLIRHLFLTWWTNAWSTHNFLLKSHPLNNNKQTCHLYEHACVCACVNTFFSLYFGLPKTKGRKQLSHFLSLENMP